MSELLNEAQTAEFLGVTRGTLAVWRCRKRHGLPFAKVGRMVRYRRADLEKFIDGRMQTGAPAQRKQRGRRAA